MLWWGDVTQGQLSSRIANYVNIEEGGRGEDTGFDVSGIDRHSAIQLRLNEISIPVYSSQVWTEIEHLFSDKNPPQNEDGSGQNTEKRIYQTSLQLPPTRVTLVCCFQWTSWSARVCYGLTKLMKCIFTHLRRACFANAEVYSYTSTNSELTYPGEGGKSNTKAADVS